MNYADLGKLCPQLITPYMQEHEWTPAGCIDNTLRVWERGGTQVIQPLDRSRRDECFKKERRRSDRL